MTFIIESATGADAAALATIGAETFDETFGHLYSAENLARFLEEHHSVDAWRETMADPRAAAWLARAHGGDVVGYALIGPCTLPVADLPANAGELSRLYVLKSAHGAGLGRVLLDRAMQRLEEVYGAIYLSVWSENYRAQDIYRARGFRKIADYKYMVGDHADDEWIMKRF